LRLFLHQLQEARALPIVELQLLQGLDESADDGQRRLELVRDVGDEVAAHARHGFHLRDVARDQELLGDAERNDLDGERHPGIALRLDDDAARVVVAFDVTHELRLAHEVHERRALVLSEIEAEEGLRALVRPLDAIGRIEHHHAVGNGFGRALEALDRVR
jgi:hypothetical protein